MLSCYCWGPPAAPPAVAIGTAKPTPTKKSWLAGLARRGDDADHLTRPVEQRAAAVAGVDGGVELDEALERRRRRGARSCGRRPTRRRRVRLRRRPSGLPTAKTVSPTGGGPAEHRGHDDLREPVDGEHGDVVLRPARGDPGGRPGAVGELDLDLRRRRRRRAGR